MYRQCRGQAEEGRVRRTFTWLWQKGKQIKSSTWVWGTGVQSPRCGMSKIAPIVGTLSIGIIFQIIQALSLCADGMSDCFQSLRRWLLSSSFLRVFFRSSLWESLSPSFWYCQRFSSVSR